MKRSAITGSLMVIGAVLCGFVFGKDAPEEAGAAATSPKETSAAATSDAELAKQAVSADRGEAQRAIEQLRSRGPAGLQALLKQHAPVLASRAKAVAKEDAAWERLSAAINAVGGQYDCHASRLFWHTDFESAKAAAAREGKPILSLRLLGKLNEECSCANSRFFRTTLYANHTVSQYLRDHFVLHWKSVRPVPKVTIDFGDGRVLHRTLTGNSIHYVLDVHGRTIDALPGLYGPAAFLSHLQQAEQLAKRLSPLDDKSSARSCRTITAGGSRRSTPRGRKT